MADSDLLVTISGAALSLLFFENVRSLGNQMGFLLGEAHEFIVKTYTDSDNQVETVKIHINVESIVTCPLPDLLHNSTYRINKEKLKDFVRDKSKQVIGWFSFRRNTTNLTLTMKDKILHKQFASHFSGGNDHKEEFFLTCLLSASMSETFGTHKFRHVFLKHNRGIFEPISLKINNLGDDAFRHDGSDYKPTPIRKSTPDGFTELIESLNLDVTKIGGLNSAMLIQRAAEQHLMSLIPKVCESDREVAELERQVQELRTKITLQQISKKLKINGEYCDRMSKASRENCFSEKISNSSTKNEIRSNDDMRLQREHTTSCAQLLNNRTISRNTAACIAKNAEKSRRLGHSNLQESDNQQQETQNSFTKHFIPEIATEPICVEEGVEISMGRGRGRAIGWINQETTSNVKKGRRIPGTSHMRSSRERSTASPEQDFSDIDYATTASPSSPVLRSYNQGSITRTKKTNPEKCNSMMSLDT